MPPIDSARSQPTPVRWRIVALLMALCFISHLNRISMAVAGDERIMKQFSIAPEKMGAIYSAFLLVYTLCMIPGGFFIDRFGARILGPLMRDAPGALAIVRSHHERLDGS